MSALVFHYVLALRAFFKALFSHETTPNEAFLLDTLYQTVRKRVFSRKTFAAMPLLETPARIRGPFFQVLQNLSVYCFTVNFGKRWGIFW